MPLGGASLLPLARASLPGAYVHHELVLLLSWLDLSFFLFFLLLLVLFTPVEALSAAGFSFVCILLHIFKAFFSVLLLLVFFCLLVLQLCLHTSPCLLVSSRVLHRFKCRICVQFIALTFASMTSIRIATLHLYPRSCSSQGACAARAPKS